MFDVTSILLIVKRNSEQLTGIGAMCFHENIKNRLWWFLLDTAFSTFPLPAPTYCMTFYLNACAVKEYFETNLTHHVWSIWESVLRIPQLNTLIVSIVQNKIKGCMYSVFVNRLHWWSMMFMYMMKRENLKGQYLYAVYSQMSENC